MSKMAKLRLRNFLPLLLGVIGLLCSGCNDSSSKGWKGKLDVRQRGRSTSTVTGDLLGRDDGVMLFNVTLKGHEMTVIDDPSWPNPITLVHLLRIYMKMQPTEIENA